MDVLRTEFQSYLTSYCCVIRSVYHVCAKLRLDQYLIMNALERNVPYGTPDLGLIRLHDIQILRTKDPPQ